MQVPAEVGLPLSGRLDGESVAGREFKIALALTLSMVIPDAREMLLTAST
jgi:hypothetical protein